jgi:arginine-tRNA-protein transferase
MKREGSLLGIAHLDITDSSLSAIYCYYNTDYRSDSLGTFAILKSIEIARSRSISHVYLGYYVKECSHMNYKIRFRPNQALVAERNWRDFAGDSIDSVPSSILRQGFRPKKRFRPPFDGHRNSTV